MRIWISTGGSHGDVHPFLALGQTLRRRGHDVLFAAHPYFRKDVEGAGLRLYPVGEQIDLEAILRDPQLMHPTRGTQNVLRLLLETVEQTVPAVREACRAYRPDVILAHHLCLGIRWVATELATPLALVALAPISWLSYSDPVPPMQRYAGRVRAALARPLLPLLTTIFTRVADRQINRMRLSLGYAAERGVMRREMIGGDLNLGLWSPTFRGATAHDPANSRICGFPWYDRSDRQPELTSELEQFLAAGAAPIVFSLGTAVSHAPGDFYRVAAAACERAGMRGVLLYGPAENQPASLPRSLIGVPYAPFSLLLPRAAATVHHGGVGSTAQALRSGRPAVIIPHSMDQFHNGLTAEKLGAALSLPRTRLSVARLAERLRAATSDSSLQRRARELAAGLAHEDGATVASECVEQLAAQRGAAA